MDNKLIYKKTDSLLRGNPGSELEAVMDAIGADIALVAPSYPANGRVVKDGHSSLYEDGNLFEESRFSILDIMRKEMTRQVENIPLEIVRQNIDEFSSYINSRISEGGIVFVVDAIDDEDLRRISKVRKMIDSKVVLCGSAGLAQQLVDKRFKHSIEINMNKVGIILIISGTRNICTLSQINNILDLDRSELIKISTELIIKGQEKYVVDDAINSVSRVISEGNDIVVISLDNIFESDSKVSLKESCEGIDESQKIVKTLGNIVEEIYSRFNIKAIIATGGDTAMQICKSINAEGIELLDEIAPGIPIGEIKGGTADGTIIVTKSGGFGAEDIFTKIIDYIEDI